jgi:hypothetical protein
VLYWAHCERDRASIATFAHVVRATNFTYESGKRKRRLSLTRVVSHTGEAVIGNSGLPVETTPVGQDTFDTVVFVGSEVELMLTASNIAAARQLLVSVSRGRKLRS